MSAINTHEFRMPSGRHKGELITRVPVGYLKWMVNSGHPRGDYAAAELARRGTITPTLDVSSGHAIDRASIFARRVWKQTRTKDEGLYSWLCRVAAEALQKPEDDQGRHRHLGFNFVFEKDGVWPVLKTIVQKDGMKVVNGRIVLE